MLRIRLTRTGKRSQPSFRIVVAENTAPIKGRNVEILGHYLIARAPKVVQVDQERVKYWISKGAIPSDTVASLLKKEGMEGMDKYLKPRTLQRKKRKESKGDAKPVPAEGAKPAADEPTADEPTADEPTAETKEETVAEKENSEDNTEEAS